MHTLLLRLREKGNTVLVVEHKPEVIAIADHLVDRGPAVAEIMSCHGSTPRVD
jgi:excinuclease UvrABC ATPase subunit